LVRGSARKGRTCGWKIGAAGRTLDLKHHRLKADLNEVAGATADLSIPVV
jgi:hypothetical protein